MPPRSDSDDSFGEKYDSRSSRSYKARRDSSDSDLEEGRRSSSDSQSSGPYSSASDSDDPPDDRDRGRERLVPPRREPAAAAARPQAVPPSSNRNVVLFVGIGVILCLTFLAGFAIHKYVDSSAISDGGAVETVTITVGGSTIKQTVSATSAKEPTAKEPTSKPASSATATSSAEESEETESSSGGFGGSEVFPGLSKNGIGVGMLPDYQDQTLVQINEGLGFKSSFHGWYAQLPESGEWDGSQLLGSVLDDVKASGAIFQPAVMPNKNNWNGLSSDDNYQALAIAKVMKKFTSEGIEVWLRFAHEVNWYQSDGTYSGGVEEFKTAWKAVAEAVKDDPLVFMFFTPNIAASLDDYTRYFPDDVSSVHYIGIDYYPKSASESFVEHMKPFYDAYCKDGTIKFAMGETGTMWDATIEEQLAWMDQMTSKETAEAMPHYVGTSWFNYDKEQAFKLWKSGEESDNSASKSWFATDTVAEGAKMGNG